MQGSPGQFRVLYRISLSRMAGLEVYSGGGDNLAVRFVSVLAAFSFTLAFLIVPRYATATLPRAGLLRAAWNDEEFLISTTMAIAGLFAVLAWNSVFPDKGDSLILGPLPVRARTFVLAKLAAAGT